MSSLQSRLSPVKQALLRRLAQAAAPGAVSRDTIPKRSGQGPAQLSFAQQRLWFLEQLEPSSSYNMPAAMRVAGPLKVHALEQTISEIIRRHESLRTNFQLEQDQPIQIVRPTARVQLRIISAGEPSSAQQESVHHRLASEEAQRLFQLDSELMIRAALILLGENDSILLLTMHHIASDGWSLGLLVSELCALYESFAYGTNSRLRELSIQYSDFAVWQREWMQGAELDKRLAYWKQQLAGAPQVIEIPTDHPRPPEQSFRGATLALSISPGISEPLKAICVREEATLFMGLLAGFQTMLYRYVGRPDIVVGSPIANRNLAQIEALIGFFVNTLVLRTDLSGSPDFRGALARVKEVTLDAYDNQELPFERLVEEMHPSRSLSFNPLVQISFALQNAPASDLIMPDVTFRSAKVDATSTRFDLEFHIYDKGSEGLSGFVAYSTDLFEQTTIRRLIWHFNLLLAGIVRDPHRSIALLELLSDGERQQVLREWNDSVAEYPGEQSLAALFEDQADRRPDAVALVMSDAQITYLELNTRSNRLANYLGANGTGLEQPVGSYAVRDLETITGLLAILKAGGAYVPLDPEYPPQLLATMIEDAAIKIVLAPDRTQPPAPAPGVRSIFLRDEWEQISQEAACDPRCVAAGDNLACIMFTSGSTGKSKGVEVLQRSVARLVRSANYANLGPDQVFLQLAPIAFDVSTLEIWGPLLNGGRLAILPPCKPSLSDIGQAIEEHRVTTLWLTAGLFHQMVGERVDALAGVPQLLAGGDVLSLAQVNDCLSRYPATKLINGYGPTENTTFTTCYPMTRPCRLGSVPIGRPISNTTAYILGEQCQPVPSGVTGELFAGLDGVARGYLRRPDITAARFVPDPFSPAAGARMYNTGDLARYLQGGDIEFLGRSDNQIKLRGHRVEPGEIEATLLEHPAVRDAVVIAKHYEGVYQHTGEKRAGDKRIVAYVVQDSDARHRRNDIGILEEGQLEGWRMLFDQTYGEAEPADPSFNISGWNSSYTGEAIPEEEMKEWRDSTLSRILALGPKRVLEIGSGTGLLLLNLAPHCEEYVGTDLSTLSVDRLNRDIADNPLKLGNARVLAKPAHDFAGIATEHFDLVILNSVVQYFPDIEYLLDVLRGASRAVRQGGTIFVGDVRNRDLLNAFHTSVEIHRAAPDLSIDALRTTVTARIRQEGELVVSPKFFEAVSLWAPEITEGIVRLKRGRHQNELTKYRYDVLLHVGAESQGFPQERIEWHGHRLADLASLIQDSSAQILTVTGIPNTRLRRDLIALESVEGQAPLTATAGTIRSAVRELTERESAGIDPEDLYALGIDSGYATDVRWPVSGRPDRYDAVFASQALNTPDMLAATLRFGTNAWNETGNLSEYANNPLRGRIEERLVNDLTSLIKSRLPEYMNPWAYVVLDELPLTPNGKVDRKRLPSPGMPNGKAADVTGPRTPEEEVLTAIWRQVLGIEMVGLHDNFFELGGHSLTATQIISRVREAFNLEIPLSIMFSQPTLEGFANAIGQTKEKAEKLEARPIKRTSREGPIPLSFAQRRLWFIDRLVPNSPAYNMPFPTRIEGYPSVAAVADSLAEIVRRHSILRTTFQDSQGSPVQVVSPFCPQPMPVVDLAGLPEAEMDDVALRLANEEARRPFDLNNGPVIRSVLLRIGQRIHVLLLTMHHIVSDGWSIGILIKEFSALYGAYAQGQPSRLQELDVQYADFSNWQAERLQGEMFEQQCSYWKARLAKDVPPLRLPVDRPRRAVPTLAGACIAGKLDRDITEAFRNLSRREGFTLFMALMAAFQALLHRYTGEDEIRVGTPIAGRHRGEIENLIGFFVNTLVINTDCSGRPGFLDLARRVRQASLGAYAHQDLTFERLVEEIQPQRDLSRNPIFQVVFALQNTPGESAGVAGLHLTSQPLSASAARFDLEWQAWEHEGQIDQSLTYSTDLFDEATIKRMLRHFETMARGVTSDPARPISDLPLLTDFETSQLLLEYNDTAVERPGHEFTHHLFELQAGRTPDSVAVLVEGHFLTYDALNRRSNQLARHLWRLGSGPETLVAIYINVSPEMIISIIGVLKSGAAYLPLDPSDPKARLASILSDLPGKLILTDQKLAETLPVDANPTLSLDSAWSVISGETDNNLDLPLLPQGLAYVIYTSGSTGVPKGVQIQHSALANLARWHSSVNKMGVGDRQSQVARLAFDASVWEILPPLISGAAVALPDQQTRAAWPLLEKWLRREAMTLCFLPTPLAQSVLDDQLPGSLGLRTLFTGGDKLSRVPERPLPFEFVNLYGPTEYTAITTGTTITTGGDSPPSIGRPISNTQVYVFSGDMSPLPVGVAGELYLGGIGVARGYMNAPETTSEKFLPDPVGNRPGARLYRTGDLARYLPDGNLDFIGRVDRQVKIRGFRIELREIEKALEDHGLVRKAAVTVNDINGRERELAAYVEPIAEGSLSANDLRRFLKDRLPQHMAPARFAIVERLPLTKNGKIDLKKLAQFEAGAAKANDYVAPRNEIESALAEIWEDLLNVRPVGVADDFFDLGGHSLLAVRLMSRVQNRFGKQIPLTTLFQASTIADLGAWIEETNEDRVSEGAGGRQPGSWLIPLQPLGSRPPIFCVQGVGGAILDLVPLARLIGPDQPFYTFQPVDDLLDTSIETMAARYVEGARSVHPEEPYFLAGWSFGALVAFEMAIQLNRMGQNIDMLALLDPAAPIQDNELPRYACTQPDQDEPAALASLALELIGCAASAAPCVPESIRSEAELLAFFEHLREAGVLPPEIPVRQVLERVRRIRREAQAIRFYRPEAYSGTIEVFQARDSIRGNGSAGSVAGHSRAMAWDKLGSSQVNHHLIPGNHFTMLSEPNVRVLAMELTACIERRKPPTR